jgi:hypothetical protein
MLFQGKDCVEFCQKILMEHAEQRRVQVEKFILAKTQKMDVDIQNKTILSG